MSASPPSRRLNAASPWFVFAAVILCLGMAVYFVPRQDELVKRLVEDGEHARAIEIAIGKVEAPPVLKPEAETQPTPLEMLQMALVQPSGTQAAKVDAVKVIESAGDPQACLDLITTLSKGMDGAAVQKLLTATAHSALAKNDPRLAAEIFARAMAQGSTSEELLSESIQAMRWAGPEYATKALEALRHWKAAGHPTSDKIIQTEISLLREMNRPGEALDLLLEEFAHSPSTGSAAEKDVALLVEVAANAGQTVRVLPVLEKFILASPAGQASFDDLASAKVRPDGNFLKLAKLIAQHSEWNGNPEKAMDYYMKLGVCGDMQAVERVEELQLGLKRQADWLALLRHVAPTPYKMDWTLKLARLQADASNYDEAKVLYEGWLHGRPNDIAAWKELAAMEEEQSDLPAALAVYEKAKATAPGDLEIKKSIASIQIALGQFSAAYEFYETLPEGDHDAATLENYALLAESLAQYKAYNRALVLRQHRLKNPTPQDYFELARSFQIIGDSEGLITTYEDGMERLPKSRMLRLELAEVHRREGNYDEAISLLALPELKSDMHAMQLFIEACCLKEDYQYALSFLGHGIENKFAFGPEVRLDLGHIYFNNGYAAEADAMYSSVDDEPTLWPLLASARFKRGDFAGAETYQQKYLAGLRVPDAEGWLFMGDIYKAEGKETEAQGAYAKSLALLEQKISPAPENAKTAETKTHAIPQ